MFIVIHTFSKFLYV